jgi:hypothetical protein
MKEKSVETTGTAIEMIRVAIVNLVQGILIHHPKIFSMDRVCTTPTLMEKEFPIT